MADGTTGEWLGQSSLIPALDQIATFDLASPSAAGRGIYGFDSRDLRSRPFNLLRTRLLKMMEAEGWKSIGIVSATPGAGKSFLSSNLAAALSRTPDKAGVYLFDFDLRRSSVADIFGCPVEAGLNQYLSGKVETLARVGSRPSTERLAIFPSRPTKRSSAELLRGPRMERLVDAMKQLPPDIVQICDLPPVFANDDAVIIASHLDAFILVIEEGRTTKKQVRDSINLLAPAVLAGTVLNRYVGGILGDDYGYGYGHKDEYADYYS